MSTRSFFLIALLIACSKAVAVPSAGFFLPDSLFEFSMRYKTVDDLIILPVTINDSVHVNLILDTGCRNMLLFGKRFEKLFSTQARPVEFSGLGSGNPVKGKLSLDNHVSIQAVEGRRIPIIIVPEKNLFSSLRNVHGIIGYEIFAKFEIELNFPEKRITFRSSPLSVPHADFQYVSMKVVDSKPVLEASVLTAKGHTIIKDLLIDTGSSLGLLISLDEKNKRSKATVGRGLNGVLSGQKQITRKLILDKIEFSNVSTSIVYSGKNYASIGMDILKDQVIILNYARAYAAFRKMNS